MTDKDKGTATLTLHTPPTERQKAGARLMQAAMLYSMTVLQQGANGLAALADSNDLSFRRDGGNVDLSVLLNDSAAEKTADGLMEAALAFAEASQQDPT